jgi:DNA repair protein RecO (recombination protein O)
MLITDYAIVLNTKKFGDTSKIISVYTKENGKLSLIAKGARNSKSKYGASLEPLSYNKISYYLYHNKDLHLLGTSEFNTHFKHLSDSMDHLTSALAVMESISLSQEQYHKNEDLFNLIIDTLTFLNEIKSNPFSTYVKFQIALMNILGFGLKFDSNYIVFQDDVYINIEKGELDNSRTGFKMYKINFNKMKYLSENSISDSAKVEFDDISAHRIAGFINRYFQHHLDKHYFINSLGMFE